MKTDTSVSDFNITRNRIMGRLTQATDPTQLYNQLIIEAAELKDHILGEEIMSAQEKDMLIGIDRGIKAADKAIAGDHRAIDEL